MRQSGQRHAVAWAILVLLAAACSPAPAGSPAATGAGPGPTSSGVAETPSPAVFADLILRGGNVRTLDPSRPIASAVAVSGDRIVAVGSDAEVGAYAGPATRTYELGGLTATPGFIDTHQHRIGDGPRVTGLDAASIVGAAVRQGLTTIDELYVDAGRLDELRTLDEAGALPLRVNAYLPVNENSPEGRSLGDYYDAYRPGQLVSPHVRVAGLKVFTDYANATILLWDQAGLDAFIEERYRAGWHLAIKVISTESLEMALDAMEASAAVSAPGIAGTRLEHMPFATADQISRLAALGIVPVINLNIPGEVVGDADFDELIAREPAGSYAPWRSLFDASVAAAGMSGFPAYYVDEPSGAPFGSPVHLIYQAVTRVGNLGTSSPPELLGQAISADQALRSLTVNAAAADGEADVKGSLTVGRLADLVVLSGDPLDTANPAEINDIRVFLTLVGGNVAWCDADAWAACDGASGSSASADPDPHAAIAVTASAALPANPAEWAVDGDAETAWIAGAGADQWLQVDLGSALAIEAIRLVVSQYPDGLTTHEVWIGSDPGALQRIATLEGETADGDVLTVDVPSGTEPVRYVRVVTTTSPSWVAWREVEVVAAS